MKTKAKSQKIAFGALSTGMVSAIALAAGSTSAEAQSFDGLYGGLALGVMFGDGAVARELDEGVDDYTFDGSGSFGAFVGYNRTMSNGMIAGAEFNIQSGGEMDSTASTSGEGDYRVTNMMDFRLRLGTELNTDTFGGPVMVYAFGGYTTGDATRYYGSAPYEFTGANYGVGVESMVSDSMSIGLELLGRTLSTYGQDDNPRETRSHGQVTLRAAFHF
jgi:hypothetical protein